MGQLIFPRFEVTKIKQTEEKVDVRVQVRSEECRTRFLLVGLITVFSLLFLSFVHFFYVAFAPNPALRQKPTGFCGGCVARRVCYYHRTCCVVRCACSSVRFAGRLDWLLQWDVAHSGQKVELASASWAAGFYLNADCCEN